MVERKKPVVKQAAVCFSGLARTLDLCYPYIKRNLLDQLESYDIFCYAEDDKDFEKIKLLKPTRVGKIKSSQVDQIIRDDLKFLNKKNYVNFIYPQSNRFNLRNVYQQLYKVHGVFRLLEDYMKEEGVKYKYYIRIRFDFIPLDPLDLDSFKIGAELVVPNFDSRYNLITDVFCFTKDFNTFKKFSELYLCYRDNAIKHSGFKPSFFQKLYFMFEKRYINLMFFLFKNPRRKQSSLERNLLGVSLMLTKNFYKEFKSCNWYNTEKAIYIQLKINKLKFREEKINLAIVRGKWEGTFCIK